MSYSLASASVSARAASSRGAGPHIRPAASCPVHPVRRLCSSCRSSSSRQAARLRPAASAVHEQQQQSPAFEEGEEEDEDEDGEWIVLEGEESEAAAQSDAQDDEDARQFAIAMSRIADDVKAKDIRILHVGPLVTWTRYMVICTVMSRPQLMACLDRVERAAHDWQRSKQNAPGASPWEVLDFGAVLVHVFTPETREYFDLESFYGKAEDVELPFETHDSAPAADWTTEL